MLSTHYQHLRIDRMFLFLITFLLFSCQSSNSTKAQTNKKISTTFERTTDTIKGVSKVKKHGRTFKKLQLVKTIQSNYPSINNDTVVFDPSINSPKSVIYNADGDKFYVNSLEGFTTTVYDSRTLKKLKDIKHSFNDSNQFLFKNNETTVFDYPYKQERENLNHFKGKPVEGCLSHNGKYLWITYYRRNFDLHAESPSALAIIDTEKDEIIRVIPTGPLPKMIACSNDNKYIAVTHWGDNTVGIIDINSSNVFDFKYIKHIVIDEKMELEFDEKVDRDNDCGNCLRGTTFNPENTFLFVAKMGGNGIAVIDLKDLEYKGTLSGSLLNLRHIVINNHDLYTSSNRYGAVQKIKIDSIPFRRLANSKTVIRLKDWKTIEIGKGVRTIEVTRNGKYVFACVNNEGVISVIESATMNEVFRIEVSKFPVGMALSGDGNQLITTSQGKDGIISGNAVNVYEVIYD